MQHVARWVVIFLFAYVTKRALYAWLGTSADQVGWLADLGAWSAVFFAWYAIVYACERHVIAPLLKRSDA